MGFQEWSPTPQGEYPYVPPSTLNTYEHAFQGSRLRPAHIGDSSCYAAARAQIRRHRHRTSPVLQPLQRTGPSASESRVVFTVSVMCTGGVPRSAANCCVRPSVLCVLRVRLVKARADLSQRLPTMRPWRDRALVPCGHMWWSACIVAHAKKKRRCPSCEASFKAKDLLRDEDAARVTGESPSYGCIESRVPTHSARQP